MGENGAAIVLQVGVGIALLMLGRRLYWVFVAGVGFIVAMQWAGELLGAPDRPRSLLIAVAAGIVGALLALFAQKLAVGLAGFLAGGYLVQTIAPELGIGGQAQYVFALVGGVVGAIIAGMLLDWALIVLSSLLGAALLVDIVDLGPASMVAMWIVALVGISIQMNMMRRDRTEDR